MKPARIPNGMTSAVTIFKEMYRRACQRQRQQMRAWMLRVLSGEDGKP